MSEKIQPGYYAIIPANVRYSKIKANAKLLYGEITCLSNKGGFCWASNKYFAELYDVSEKQVSQWVSELKDAGFISVEIDQKAGNKRFISINEKVATYTPKGDDPYTPKGYNNNTSINNINNNTKTPFLSSSNFEIDPSKLKAKRLKEPFNLEKEIKELEAVPGSANDHLASYIWYKNLEVENMDQLVVLKKRNGKITKDLSAYSRERVQDVMVKLNKKAEHEENIKGELNVVEWTLETVLKTLQK